MNKMDYESFLQSAIESNQVFLWSWEMDGDRLTFSPGTETFFLGETPEPVGSISVLMDRFLDSANRKLMHARIDEAKENGIIRPYELQLRLPDGSTLWLEVSGRVITNAAGQPIRMVGTFQDVTALKVRILQSEAQQAFLESLIELFPYPVFYKNRRGIFEFCNEKFCDSVKAVKEQIIGKTDFDLYPHDIAMECYESDRRLITRGGRQRFETVLRFRDGETREVCFDKTVYSDASGRVLGLMGLIRDITDEKLAARMAQKREEIRELFLKISHLIGQEVEETYLFDSLIEGLVQVFDHANYGSILEVVDNRHLTSLSSHGYREHIMARFRIPLESSYIYRLSGGNLTTPHIFRNIRGEGEIYPDNPETKDGGIVASVLSIPVFLDDSKNLVICLDASREDGFDDRDLEIADFIAVQIPILYQVFQLNRRNVALSRYDNLTGLANRGYFQSLLEDRIALSGRSGDDLLLLMMDLDGLKAVNDRYGHHAGDAYLSEFSRHIQSFFRDTDVFARIGGDEFAGIFLTADKTRLKEKIADFSMQFRTLSIQVDGHRFTGGFAYGIADYGVDGDDMDTLLKAADMRMYAKKKADRPD